MNQNANVGADGNPAQPEAADLLMRMRELLPAGAKKIEPALAADVARQTHLLTICFAKEQDEIVALQCLALIGVAIVRGSKETAKRKPKAIRWTSSTPPSLQVLASDEERRAAIKLLPSATNTWVVPYALRESAIPLYGKDLVAELVKWACKSVETNADLLAALEQWLRSGVTTDIDRIALVLKVFLKSFSEAPIPIGLQFSEAFLDLASALNTYCLVSGATSKQKLTLQSFGLALIDTVSSKEPAILFTPQIQQAIISLSALSNGWKKPSDKLLQRLAGRMLSISLLSSQIHGIEGSSDIRSILALAAKALPLERTGKVFSAQRVAIKELLQPIAPTEDGATKASSPNASIQEQIATLLLAWDAFRRTLPSPDLAKEIDYLIESISTKVSVERFGQPGEIQSFHPLRHNLLDSEESPPTSVKIEVPGVRANRADGSFRVLVKALTVPAK
jgi:hypothetical protein